MRHVYNSTGHELKLPDIDRGEGVYLYDSGGKRYMDLESGVWCMSVGHSHPRVLAAMARQSGSLVQAGFNYSNPIVDDAAALALRIAGMKDGKCVFLCSGSEGIEYSRQVAKHLTGKPTSITLHDSYLGAYASVRDRDTGWHLFDWTACEHCNQGDKRGDHGTEDRANGARRSGRCDPGCECLQAIPDTISDFVFEPGSAGGFVRFPPVSLIRNIVDRVKASGGKIIANEVTTGIGRTGKWFGFQHYGIEPDMVAMGKGIGNGYPVSVAAMNRATVDELEAKPFHYAQSHQNDPLGAAVVKEVIDVIEEHDLIADAARKGELFLRQLRGVVDGAIALAVRGRGLMFAVNLVDEKATDEIHSRLTANGFLVGNRSTALRIDPPLITTEEQFSTFVDALKAEISAADNR